MLAADAVDTFSPDENILDGLEQFVSSKNDWLFGHFNYDLKNHIDTSLHSSHPDGIKFPGVFLFQPGVLIRKKNEGIEISSITRNPAEVFTDILSINSPPAVAGPLPAIQQRISREKYLETIHQLRQHILRGDCYEINFCQEFFAEDATIDPLSLYQKLSTVSPNPFGGFYKLNDKFLLCASPERFLQKTGNRIISQPIKGTIKRNLSDAAADKKLREELSSSKKDKSENVMIVDLVRNDLGKFCKEASVHVEELYGIYSFPQVHQMISTIAGELSHNTSFTDILKATFPMGSMTGAPKKRVMELTEQYEHTKRGIYAGSIGYITPGKDFDLNVVIRSIMYNQSDRYLSYQVGGGITFYSDPQREYEECLLKAAAIKKVLNESAPS